MSKLRNTKLLFAIATLAMSLGFIPGANAASTTHLVISTQPSGAVNGAALTVQPVVKIVDAANATISSGPKTVVTAAITSGTGTLSGTLTATAVSGVATFTNLAITGVAGNFSLAFTSSPALDPVASAPFALAAGAATKLVLTTPAPTAVSDTTFTTSPVITILDASGNTAISNTSMVTVTITGGTGGTLLGAYFKNAVAGVATFDALGIRGTRGMVYTLTYSDGGLTAATQTISLTGRAFKLAVTTPASGATSGVAFTTQPVVTVQDFQGNTSIAESGPVNVAVVGGGATLIGAPTVATTGGVATFAGIGVIGTPGISYTLTFSDGALVVARQTITLANAVVPQTVDSSTTSSGVSNTAGKTKNKTQGKKGTKKGTKK